jgi:hypothetical protein
MGEFMKYAVIAFMFLFVGSIGCANAQERCGIENCHGIDIVCGPNVPEMCTMMYGLGDFCRDYARCEVLEGDCRLVKDPILEVCTTCVRKCIDTHQEDPIEVFNCEGKCREEVVAMLGSTGNETNEAEAGAGQVDGAYSVDARGDFGNVEEGNFGASE